ncbi:hypothetical protein QWY77_06525 [Thalassotalea ponticola]|uniref:hypothetical protein n=1 Tax=Thalassotalea ponticola TaxID=1523392 RepID=UPI0025B297AF|nr:hypothetical protein [Thalassotalea ponticola]MDN3652417.1 hypothetical protein [Thalassotalea ponticola]
MKQKIQKAISIVKQMADMPTVPIDLQLSKAKDNDPFFQQVTQQFYRQAMSRHNKYLLIRQLQYGVALFAEPHASKDYFMSIESSARRNYRKAVRFNYRTEAINFNDYLDDIWEIRKSAKVRQGEMPEEFIQQRPQQRPVHKSNRAEHDYCYYGVLDEDNKLVAYAAFLVAGELCMLEHMYGHAKVQHLGVVPQLIIDAYQDIKKRHPQVLYYAYGSFFGASDNLKRFKKKMGFKPYKVNWQLN